MPGLALGTRFANTHDRYNAGATRGLRLCTHRRVGLAMKSPAFGMADNDCHGAGVFEHFGRNIPGISTRSQRVAVLAADCDA